MLQIVRNVMLSQAKHLFFPTDRKADPSPAAQDDNLRPYKQHLVWCLR
jgi:hypothetical protein